MSWQLKSLNVPQVDPARLEEAIGRLVNVERPRFRRLWAYYRNPLRLDPSCTNRPYRQAQEWGLPSRITGIEAGCEPFTGQATAIQRKEVVIENDIGWRIETMVDYLFGKPVAIRSAAADPKRREVLDRLIQAILDRQGGILFLQQLALMGAVYGFVDVLVKLENSNSVPIPSSPMSPPAAAPAAAPGAEALPQPASDAPIPSSIDGADAFDNPSNPGAGKNPLDAQIQRIARMIRLEIVEPARAVPLQAAGDYRALDAYVQHYEVPGDCNKSDAHGLEARATTGTSARWWQRLFSAANVMTAGRTPAVSAMTEIISATAWQRYRDGKLVLQGENSLGEIPLVHIQNSAVPFEYAGASDVEPLLPLQDELNTRLSDRAHRIAMQSFKMYLAKGIENFLEMPVTPGRMWATDNQDASVQEFGGDSDAPSENLHIADVREALDKTSGVSPIAAGAIKNRIGRLTSAAALRITLISLLAKTEKKRTTYGAGIAGMIEMALRWLDLSGAFPNMPAERAVEIHWPSPLPENEAEKLGEAEIKLRVGVAKEVVLRELGY